MSFADDLKAATEQPSSYLDVEVAVNGNLHTLRFGALDPFEWANTIDQHAARPGVMIDARYGYNLRAVVRAVAPLTGRLVDGDKTDEIEDWPALFTAIGGSGVQRVSDAVFALNEYMSEKAVVDAKKALAASRS